MVSINIHFNLVPDQNLLLNFFHTFLILYKVAENLS